MIGRGERRATGAFTKFRLLMWKNFLQQWRLRVQTIVELLLPFSAMALLLIMRSQIKPSLVDSKTYPSIPAYSLHHSLIILKGMNISQLSIAYSPESPVLENILKKATARLISLNKEDKALKHLILDRFPEIIPPTLDLLGDPDAIEKLINIRVQAYKNSEGLQKIYPTEDVTRRVIAGVEFDDSLYVDGKARTPLLEEIFKFSCVKNGFGIVISSSPSSVAFRATRLPTKLIYSLRFPERPRKYSFYSEGAMSWHTDATFPRFQLTGPRNPYDVEGGAAPGYVIEMFIALQHLISMELVVKLTALDLSNFKVAIQRYPHPSYMQDFGVESMQFLLPMLIMVSFSYIAINTVKAIVVEKEKLLKETMKIMGLPTWLHWTAWFSKQFIFLLILTVIIVILVKGHWFKTEEGYGNYAIFNNTSWTLLLFFFLLYSACTIFFCFMLSGFFTKASTAASFSGMIWFLTYLPATMLMMDLKISTAMQVLLCLSFNSAMAFGFHFMVVEESAQGLQWSQFWQVTDLYSNRFVFGTVVVMLVVDSALYMLVALYLEQVLPGPQAVSQPWNFIFRKQFWVHKKVMTAGAPFELEDAPDVVMEKVLGNHTIGVKMRNLTKSYGQSVAVDNLCLDMFNDQITVLLGHNDAGKSTTIAMLTGTTEISSGSVWLAGYDMSNQKEGARANLGYCPQNNVLFNELTVREHLELFGRLRGLTGQELLEDIDTLITKLQLKKKRDYESAGLSGGQKRRLSIAIALSGGPRVVLLDEPTAGMDNASRRALWDLLLVEKMGRAMILTTHFMDEADYLSDRVAIMANGRLQCVGSPFFLKNHYAMGNTLVVVKKEGFQHELCTEIIRRHVPETSIKEDRGTEVAYTLPNQSHLLETMLIDLEANIDTIKYDNYSLTATTLEDVFMSVGSDLSPNFSGSNDEDTYASVSRLSSDETQTVDIDSGKRAIGPDSLWKQHVLAVWLKLWLVWARSWRLLMMQVLVSLIMINVTLGVLHWMMFIRSMPVRRALSLTTGFLETETLLSYNGSSLSSRGAIAKNAYKQMFISANIKMMKITALEHGDVKDYYMYRTAQPRVMAVLRRRILAGATFDENSATAWFSNFGYHDVAISLNAVHQALLKTWVPDATLSVFNYPLTVNYADRGDMRIYVDHVSTQLSSGIGNSLSIVSSIFVMFYVKERIIRAKLLQKAAGIQPAVMWFSAALFDLAWFLVICITIIISLRVFKVVGLSTGSEIGRMYLVLMVYGATMLPLNYLMSLVFPGPVMGFVTMFFINIVFGNMGSQVVQLLLSPKLNTEYVAEFLDYILQFFPLYDLIRAVLFLNKNGLTEWSCLRKCEYFSDAVMPVSNCSMQAMCLNNFTSCCVSDNMFFKWEKPGILRYLTCSLIVCIVLWSLLMLVEYDVYRKLIPSTKTPPPLDKSSMNDDVVEEIRYVEQIGVSELAQHYLVAKSLSKYYGKHLAVNQVSFAMTGAEIFGLLGVNGAGKTTTFKMLMGDEAISSGDAYVSGSSVRRDITTVYKTIGYCPQFDAVFGELTGRQTLRLFSMLRGLPSQHASMRAERLADLLGLTRHLDKRVDMCSGGTKRKLSAAVALLGSTRLVFVDEPTAGVDAAAKRRVWRAILNARRAGCGVVLTSHSMVECEALCSRLTIMVNGIFHCLGTPQHLKNKFSHGFTLTIKIRKMNDGTTDPTEGERGIAAVKRYVESNFNTPRMIEEHQNLLTYCLPDRRVAWSKMYWIMERCRELYDLEDYIISRTTLEHIFLLLTKYQKEWKKQKNSIN